MSCAVGLRHHRNFLKLWGGQTISLLGAEITLLALPLTAILVLRASPLELGILTAAQSAPFLLLSLPAGALVDRLRRRPLLVAADLGRALLLGSVPCIALLGALHIEQLYVAGFCVGVLTAFFDVAYQSFLTQVVSREQLVEGNIKLEISRSLAQIAGPSVAGLLVQWLTAPVTIAADAGSFLISALAFAVLRMPEMSPVRQANRSRLVTEILLVHGNRRQNRPNLSSGGSRRLAPSGGPHMTSPEGLLAQAERSAPVIWSRRCGPPCETMRVCGVVGDRGTFRAPCSRQKTA